MGEQSLTERLFRWSKARYERQLLERFGGIQTCPWCRQCAQSEAGWNFRAWDENLFHDVLTCGVCGGTSIWHFAIGMIWVGPLDPPKSAFEPREGWMPEAKDNPHAR
jgi:hypothetical protein